MADMHSNARPPARPMDSCLHPIWGNLAMTLKTSATFDLPDGYAESGPAWPRVSPV